MLDIVVEYALHKSMSAQLLLNMSSKTCFCLELNWLEVFYVLRVEEHVAHSCFFLVNAQRVASQNDALKDDAQRVRRQSNSCGNYCVA